MVHYPILPFSVHVFQCTVNLLHLWRQCGKLAADIRCDLFLTMNAFVLFNVLGHFFGNHVMVPEQATEERRKFVAMLRSSCFHKLVCLEKQ